MQWFHKKFNFMYAVNLSCAEPMLQYALISRFTL